MINGSIQKEDLAMINIGITLNTRVPKYIKQMLTALKAKIDSETIVNAFQYLNYNNEYDI